MRGCIRPHCPSAVRQKPRAHSLRAIGEGAEESGQSASDVCGTKSCKWQGEAMALQMIRDHLECCQYNWMWKTSRRSLQFLPSLNISFPNSHTHFPQSELGSHIIIHLFCFYTYHIPCDNSSCIIWCYGLNCVLQKCIRWGPNPRTWECDCT